MSLVLLRSSGARLGICLLLALLGGLLLRQATSRAATGDQLDRSRLILTFSETFRDGVSQYNSTTGRGRWKTSYDFGDPTGPSSHTLPGELQIYSDVTYNGVEPFEQSNGKLSIVAAKTLHIDDHRNGGKPYTSGLLTTAPSFHQAYGYFEIRTRLPQGAGLWPAFWLAAPLDPAVTTPQFPGEIDVMEMLGKDPDVIYCSAHWPANRSATRQAFRTLKVSLDGTAPSRTYGVLWTSKALVWFVDDKEVARMRNPGLHKPMAVLIDLAVGGSWGGPPDQATRFPARMSIDYVRAYRIAA